MAIAANTVTLSDYALTSNSPLVRAVSFSLIENENILQDIPLMNKKTLIANGVRFEGNLPTVNWAPINSEGVTTKGTPTPYQEQLYLLRNYIDVDKVLVEEENAIVDPRAIQAEAYIKALTYDMNYKFILNDHVSGDINAPIGLKWRIDNGSDFGVRPENKINAGGLDITQGNATQATANKLLELLDQLLWSVGSPTGTGVTIYMNEVFKRRFPFLIRLMGTAGGFSITQDQFGRSVEMYKGAVLRDIGYKADQSTRIITNTETSDGSAITGSTYTSLYAVHYGSEYFFGWQFAPLNVQDLGLLNNGVIYRTLIDYAVGLMNTSTRSLGRLYGLKMS
ncbi:MAG TPA: hypothetical protein VHL10_00855 [Nitrososphaera sp.]|jgi:hypothetical protein|nr:hypothetical protein [Nitrososphaera sp.]